MRIGFPQSAQPLDVEYLPVTAVWAQGHTCTFDSTEKPLETAK